MRGAPILPGRTTLPGPLLHHPGGPSGFANGPPAPPNSCRSPTDHVSDVIGGAAGELSTLTNQLASGLATPTRVSPTFDLRSARLGDSPPTWSYLQPLTRPPELTAQSISAAEIIVGECAWRWVPSSRPPAASFQRKSFGRPWGGCLGAPLLKALSSSLAGIALLCMAPGCIREGPRTPNTNGG